MKHSFEYALQTVQNVTSYNEGIKLVYMWVKQDMITPQVMAALNLWLYKRFEY